MTQFKPHAEGVSYYLAHTHTLPLKPAGFGPEHGFRVKKKNVQNSILQRLNIFYWAPWEIKSRFSFIVVSGYVFNSFVIQFSYGLKGNCNRKLRQ